jgi:hypothetical protein
MEWQRPGQIGAVSAVLLVKQEISRVLKCCSIAVKARSTGQKERQKKGVLSLPI